MSAADYVTDGWNVAPVPGPTPDTYYPPNSIPPDAVPVAAAPANAVPYTGQTPAPGQQIIYQTAPAPPPAQTAPAQASPPGAAAQTAYVTDGWGSAKGTPGQPSATPPTLKPDFGLGFEAGMYRPLDNVTGWLGNNPVGQWIDKNVGQPLGFPSTQQQLAGHQAAIDQAAMQGRTPDKWGTLLGSALMTAPTFALTHNPALLGAMQGGLSSSSPDDPAKVALDTGVGAIGGLVGGAAIKGAQGLLSPVLGAAQKTLVDAGVRLTPGQLLGGIPHKVEDALTHLGIPNSAQGTALKDFNLATLAPALHQIGETMPSDIQAGHSALNYVDGRLSDTYNRILKPLTVAPDRPFEDDLNNIGTATAQIPGDFQGPYQSIIQQYFGKPASGNGWALSGDALKNADSKLGQVARQYARSPDPAQRDFADSLAQTRVALHDLVGRANPEAASALQGADRGYAIAMRADKAAAATNSAARDGVFTPNAYLGAIRSLDGSVRNRAFAHGDALMQPLATAGAQVLPSTVNDSGTTLRALVTMGALGLGGEQAHLLNPETLAGLGMAAAPYTKMGMSALRGLVTAPRPAWTAGASNLIGYARPAAIAAGAQSQFGLLPLAAASMLLPAAADPVDNGYNSPDPGSSQ